MDTTSGTLDEALERLHTTGPEFHGILSNHGPMAVEALVRHGQAETVHRWLDAYAAKHPVIRVGHAVRVLLEEGEEAPRIAELAHAIGYWAARHTTLPVTVRPTGTASPADTLAALPRVAEPFVRPLDGLAQLPETDG